MTFQADRAERSGRPRPGGYASARWEALGTYVSLVVADGERLQPARAACERILADIDQACSRFRPDSDLVRANSGAGTWVRVSALLLQAVAAAVRVAQATGGLVDPTIGGHLVALGYDRDLAEITLAQLNGESLGSGNGLLESVPQWPVEPGGWRAIGIDPDGALLVPAGAALDLGATGKALAADLIAADVPAECGTALIISLGGDVAVGDLPGGAQPHPHPWRVAVAERPEDAVRSEAEVVILPEGGLATSSTLARRWQRGGVSVHHLLDPRTGLPVDPVWRTASVCAASCLDANAASTAAIVLGSLAPAWLWERDLAARLVAADGRVLRVAGWPEPEPAATTFELGRRPSVQPHPSDPSRLSDASDPSRASGPSRASDPSGSSLQAGRTERVGLPAGRVR